jgi:hypothetical protein
MGCLTPCGLGVLVMITALVAGLLGLFQQVSWMASKHRTGTSQPFVSMSISFDE